MLISKMVRKMKDSEFLKVAKDESYPGNVGVMEMVKFYEKASSQESDEMNKIVGQGNWSAFKQLIQRVLGIELE